LWGWDAEGRKIACVNWKTICKSKGEGGLNIKDLNIFNTALLAKWKWRLCTEEKGLWKDVLDSKYGSWRSLDDRKFGQKESRWWNDLRKVCGSGEERTWFEESVTWRVGSGTIIKFWEDVWVGEKALRDSYPRLYLISNKKERTISECGKWKNDKWEWNLGWRREWFEWEKNLFQSFMVDLERINIDSRRVDSLQWMDGEDKEYTVKSAYEKMQGICNGEQLLVFQSLYGGLKLFHHRFFFAWRVMLKGVPTKVNLRHRRVLLNNYGCALCGEQEESVSHLFFDCKVASKVWNMCNNWVRILNVHYNQPYESFLHFHVLELNHKGNDIWKGVWVVVMWSIWKHRNNVVFNNAISDAEEIFCMAQLRVWAWMKHKSTKVSFSFSDWCMCPIHCIRSIT